MKALVETRTFWVAVIQAIVAILVIFLSTYPDWHYAGILLLVKSVLDMYLRSETTTPVGSVLPKN